MQRTLKMIRKLYYKHDVKSHKQLKQQAESKKIRIVFQVPDEKKKYFL